MAQQQQLQQEEGEEEEEGDRLLMTDITSNGDEEASVMDAYRRTEQGAEFLRRQQCARRVAAVKEKTKKKTPTTTAGDSTSSSEGKEEVMMDRSSAGLWWYAPAYETLQQVANARMVQLQRQLQEVEKGSAAAASAATEIPTIDVWFNRANAEAVRRTANCGLWMLAMYPNTNTTASTAAQPSSATVPEISVPEIELRCSLGDARVPNIWRAINNVKDLLTGGYATTTTRNPAANWMGTAAGPQHTHQHDGGGGGGALRMESLHHEAGAGQFERVTTFYDTGRRYGMAEGTLVIFGDEEGGGGGGGSGDAAAATTTTTTIGNSLRKLPSTVRKVEVLQFSSNKTTTTTTGEQQQQQQPDQGRPRTVYQVKQTLDTQHLIGVSGRGIGWPSLVTSLEHTILSPPRIDQIVAQSSMRNIRYKRVWNYPHTKGLWTIYIIMEITTYKMTAKELNEQFQGYDKELQVVVHLLRESCKNFAKRTASGDGWDDDVTEGTLMADILEDEAAAESVFGLPSSVWNMERGRAGGGGGGGSSRSGNNSRLPGFQVRMELELHDFAIEIIQQATILFCALAERIKEGPWSDRAVHHSAPIEASWPMACMLGTGAYPFDRQRLYPDVMNARIATAASYIHMANHKWDVINVDVHQVPWWEAESINLGPNEILKRVVAAAPGAISWGQLNLYRAQPQAAVTAASLVHGLPVEELTNRRNPFEYPKRNLPRPRDFKVRDLAHLCTKYITAKVDGVSGTCVVHAHGICIYTENNETWHVLGLPKAVHCASSGVKKFLTMFEGGGGGSNSSSSSSTESESSSESSETPPASYLETLHPNLFPAILSCEVVVAPSEKECLQHREELRQHREQNNETQDPEPHFTFPKNDRNTRVPTEAHVQLHFHDVWVLPQHPHVGHYATGARFVLLRRYIEEEFTRAMMMQSLLRLEITVPYDTHGVTEAPIKIGAPGARQSRRGRAPAPPSVSPSAYRVLPVVFLPKQVYLIVNVPVDFPAAIVHMADTMRLTRTECDGFIIISPHTTAFNQILNKVKGSPTVDFYMSQHVAGTAAAAAHGGVVVDPKRTVQLQVAANVSRQCYFPYISPADDDTSSNSMIKSIDDYVVPSLVTFDNDAWVGRPGAVVEIGLKPPPLLSTKDGGDNNRVVRLELVRMRWKAPNLYIGLRQMLECLRFNPTPENIIAKNSPPSVMRTANKYHKEAVFRRYVRPRAAVLELGAGKFGDVSRLRAKELAVTRLVVVEPDACNAYTGYMRLHSKEEGNGGSGAAAAAPPPLGPEECRQQLERVSRRPLLLQQQAAVTKGTGRGRGINKRRQLWPELILANMQDTRAILSGIAGFEARRRQRRKKRRKKRAEGEEGEDDDESMVQGDQEFFWPPPSSSLVHGEQEMRHADRMQFATVSSQFSISYVFGTPADLHATFNTVFFTLTAHGRFLVTLHDYATVVRACRLLLNRERVKSWQTIPVDRYYKHCPYLVEWNMYNNTNNTIERKKKKKKEEEGKEENYYYSARTVIERIKEVPFSVWRVPSEPSPLMQIPEGDKPNFEDEEEEEEVKDERGKGAVAQQQTAAAGPPPPPPVAVPQAWNKAVGTPFIYFRLGMVATVGLPEDICRQVFGETSLARDIPLLVEDDDDEEKEEEGLVEMMMMSGDDNNKEEKEEMRRLRRRRSKMGIPQSLDTSKLDLVVGGGGGGGGAGSNTNTWAGATPVRWLTLDPDAPTSANVYEFAATGARLQAVATQHGMQLEAVEHNQFAHIQREFSVAGDYDEGSGGGGGGGMGMAANSSSDGGVDSLLMSSCITYVFVRSLIVASLATTVHSSASFLSSNGKKKRVRGEEEEEAPLMLLPLSAAASSSLSIPELRDNAMRHLSHLRSQGLTGRFLSHTADARCLQPVWARSVLVPMISAAIWILVVVSQEGPAFIVRDDGEGGHYHHQTQQQQEATTEEANNNVPPPSSHALLVQLDGLYMDRTFLPFAAYACFTGDRIGLIDLLMVSGETWISDAPYLTRVSWMETVLSVTSMRFHDGHHRQPQLFVLSPIEDDGTVEGGGGDGGGGGGDAAGGGTTDVAETRRNYLRRIVAVGFARIYLYPPRGGVFSSSSSFGGGGGGSSSTSWYCVTPQKQQVTLEVVSQRNIRYIEEEEGERSKLNLNPALLVSYESTAGAATMEIADGEGEEEGEEEEIITTGASSSSSSSRKKDIVLRAVTTLGHRKTPHVLRFDKAPDNVSGIREGGGGGTTTTTAVSHQYTCTLNPYDRAFVSPHVGRAALKSEGTALSVSIHPEVCRVAHFNVTRQAHASTGFVPVSSTIVDAVCHGKPAPYMQSSSAEDMRTRQATFLRAATRPAGLFRAQLDSRLTRDANIDLTTMGRIGVVVLIPSAIGERGGIPPSLRASSLKLITGGAFTFYYSNQFSSIPALLRPLLTAYRGDTDPRIDLLAMTVEQEAEANRWYRKTTTTTTTTQQQQQSSSSSPKAAAAVPYDLILFHGTNAGGAMASHFLLKPGGQAFAYCLAGEQLQVAQTLNKTWKQQKKQQQQQQHGGEEEETKEYEEEEAQQHDDDAPATSTATCFDDYMVSGSRAWRSASASSLSSIASYPPPVNFDKEMQWMSYEDGMLFMKLVVVTTATTGGGGAGSSSAQGRRPIPRCTYRIITEEEGQQFVNIWADEHGHTQTAAAAAAMLPLPSGPDLLRFTANRHTSISSDNVKSNMRVGITAASSEFEEGTKRKKRRERGRRVLVVAPSPLLPSSSDLTLPAQPGQQLRFAQFMSAHINTVRLGTLFSGPSSSSPRRRQSSTFSGSGLLFAICLAMDENIRNTFVKASSDVAAATSTTTTTSTLQQQQPTQNAANRTKIISQISTLVQSFVNKYVGAAAAAVNPPEETTTKTSSSRFLSDAVWNAVWFEKAIDLIEKRTEKLQQEQQPESNDVIKQHIKNTLVTMKESEPPWLLHVVSSRFQTDFLAHFTASAAGAGAGAGAEQMMRRNILQASRLDQISREGLYSLALAELQQRLLVVHSSSSTSSNGGDASSFLSEGDNLHIMDVGLLSTIFGVDIFVLDSHANGNLFADVVVDNTREKVVVVKNDGSKTETEFFRGRCTYYNAEQQHRHAIVLMYYYSTNLADGHFTTQVGDGHFDVVGVVSGGGGDDDDGRRPRRIRLTYLFDSHNRNPHPLIIRLKADAQKSHISGRHLRTPVVFNNK